MIKSYTRIIFWEPCISPHKTYFISMVKKINPNIEIIYCSNTGLPEDRKKLGWRISEDEEDVKYIISPTAQEINSLVDCKIKNSLHVFSGIRWANNLKLGISAIKKYNANFAIMSEPRDDQGFKGFLRYLHSLLTERWIRQNVKFVLAQGSHGLIWYRKTLYPNKIIFPFAYFVPPLPSQVAKKKNDKLNIVYIGRLVKSKGIYEIINILKDIKHEYILHVIGDGIEKENFEVSCRKNNINYKYHGVIPNEKLGLTINNFDLLMLLSLTKDDGWGAVVSEALMSGLSVIVSNKVGSSYLMKNKLFGRSINPTNKNEVLKEIDTLIKQKSFNDECMLKRQKSAQKILSDIAGAKYFSEIVENYKKAELIKSSFLNLETYDNE